jgi:hypothetical protein
MNSAIFRSRLVLSLAAVALVTACGKGKSPNAPDPISARDPTAVTSASTSGLLIAGLDNGRSSLDTTVALTQLSWQNSYYCCGSNLTERATVAGRIDVTVGGDGITVTESIQSATDLTWGPSDRAHKLRLPADGLRVTANLVTLGEGVAPVQELRLQGTIQYFVTGPDGQNVQKSATIDLRIGYRNFPSNNESPELTGTFGPETLDKSMTPGDAPRPTEDPVIVSTHAGSFVMPLRNTIRSGFTGGGSPLTSCVESSVLNGTVRATLHHSGRGSIGGSAGVSGTEVYTTRCSPDLPGSVAIVWTLPVTGTAAALTFSGQRSSTGGGVTVTNQLAFSGVLRGGTVDGRISYARTELGANVQGAGSTSGSLILR